MKRDTKVCSTMRAHSHFGSLLKSPFEMGPSSAAFSSSLCWARVISSLGQKLSLSLQCQQADLWEGALKDRSTCVVPALCTEEHLHQRSMVRGLPPPKMKLLPEDFFAIHRDRTQMLWQLKIKVFHVLSSKIINKATQSCPHPMLIMNMQFYQQHSRAQL